MANAPVSTPDRGYEQIPPASHNMNDFSAKWIIWSGLLELCTGSNMPLAKRFKKWICGEVLPAIMQTGSYSIYPARDQQNTPEDWNQERLDGIQLFKLKNASIKELIANCFAGQKGRLHTDIVCGIDMSSFRSCTIQAYVAAGMCVHVIQALKGYPMIPSSNAGHSCATTHPNPGLFGRLFQRESASVGIYQIQGSIVGDDARQDIVLPEWLKSSQARLCCHCHDWASR